MYRKEGRYGVVGVDGDIQKIKKFNRFYLRIMGLFALYTDESPYSATEALILFEINNKKQCTASYLAEYFLFDKGYISRILNKFESRNIIKRIPSEQDRRIKFIEITKKGGDDLKELSTKASSGVANLIEYIDQKDVKDLIHAMEKIEEILSQENRKGCV